MLASSTSLLRFTTDGLNATIDSYLADALPLHRFAWELSVRVDTLAALDAPTRTLTRLRWLLRTVDLVHAAVAARTAARQVAAGQVADPAGIAELPAAHVAGPARAQWVAALTAAERSTLATAIADFSAVLATLIPRSPLDPAGAGRPADPRTVSRVVA